MARSFKYDMRTWELAVNAVRQLGGRAKASDVLDYISRHTPGYNPRNLHVDLHFSSVNCPSRVNHNPNKMPRRTDSGNECDALFKEGEGRDSIYHLYDPRTHGVWEIVLIDQDGVPSFEVRRAQGLSEELAEAQGLLQESGAFDPTDLTDARHKIAASVVSRRGQQAFRQSLLSAYGGRCAVTGCGVAEVLEAAHIVPFKGTQTNRVDNGLLLRADIHTLFDLGLLKINPHATRVELGKELLNGDYAQLEGIGLRLPEQSELQPSRAALESRYHS